MEISKDLEATAARPLYFIRCSGDDRSRRLLEYTYRVGGSRPVQNTCQCTTWTSFDYIRSGKDHYFDVLIFTQHWPTTLCELWKKNDSSHKCTMPRPTNSWTVHGIWPTKYGTRDPHDCNSSAPFDPKAIKPIEAVLNDVWTNIKYGTPKYSFWAHEWEKHGTCATALHSFNTELKYFTRAIEYNRKYNLSNILSEVDIVPSWNKGYDVVDIVNAVRVNLGVNPVVACRMINGESHLFEIRVCLSKKLKLHDCDGVIYNTTASDNFLTNCDRTQRVMYLPYNTTSNTII